MSKKNTKSAAKKAAQRRTRQMASKESAVAPTFWVQQIIPDQMIHLAIQRMTLREAARIFVMAGSGELRVYDIRAPLFDLNKLVKEQTAHFKAGRRQEALALDKKMRLNSYASYQSGTKMYVEGTRLAREIKKLVEVAL